MIKKIILSTFLGLLLAVPFSAKAAETKGIQISPLTYKFDVEAGKSQKAQITLSNLNEADLNYVIELENFKNVSEEGAPSFAVSGNKEGVTSLADWIAIDEGLDQGILKPEETKKVTFSINVPQNAEPGGHYAAVFAKEIKKDSEGRTQLGIATRVGTLILVSVPGNVKKVASISEFNPPKYVWRTGKIDFAMKITNSGTVHFDSEGKVELKPLLGKTSTVDMGIHTILPDNTRKFSGTWSKLVPFGRYIATAKANDGNGQTMAKEAVIWILPLNIIVPVLLVIILIILLLTYFRDHLKFVK